MPAVEVRAMDGTTRSTVELDPALFGIEPNVAVMHQVVTAQLAAARAGTQSTRTRAEVRGGGSKPWRQKGTGRSRQGSSRSPQWTGGGVALGPKPRSYRQRTPKKMVQLALRSALSDRAAGGRVVVVDEWQFPAPRTKEAKAALGALGLSGKVLLVVDHEDEATYKSFRNLPDVHLLLPGELNAYDVLRSDWLVFSLRTLPGADTEPAAGATPAGPTTATAPGGATPTGAAAAGGATTTEGAVLPPAGDAVASEGTVLPPAGEGQVPEEPEAGPSRGGATPAGVTRAGATEEPEAGQPRTGATGAAEEQR